MHSSAGTGQAQVTHLLCRSKAIDEREELRLILQHDLRHDERSHSRLTRVGITIAHALRIVSRASSYCTRLEHNRARPRQFLFEHLAR